MIVDGLLCNGCGLCSRDCPLGVISMEKGLAVIGEDCAQCGACIKACPKGAISRLARPAGGGGIEVQCRSCPVLCLVKPGRYGACRRYINTGARLERARTLVRASERAGREPAAALYPPLVTGVGAGTTYPCFRPAPYIVGGTRDGVDVVTVVTEAPLSYSAAKIKIDTNAHIGEEGAPVRRDGRIVGMVCTEEYGAKMISIGGPNLIVGKSGMAVARTIAELCNGDRVRLKVSQGAALELQVGCPPVIDGVIYRKMRIGCGSATIGVFAPQLKGVVDEAIILDHHIIGLFSEHAAGVEVGMKPSGITPVGRKSTAGRYFGEPGDGWGGTSVQRPEDAVASIDMSVARPGTTLLVTETTGEKAALFEVTPQGELRPVEMRPGVARVVKMINDNCEESRVSVLFTGGSGGSARAGVTRVPLMLTRAVHEGRARLTVGGAPAFVLPGGGINFMVDVEKVVPRAFYWVPTPATVAPLEYTMELEDYVAIGGHVEHIVDISELFEGEQG